MKYKITHLVTAEFVAEVIVDESEINTQTNDLKEYKKPDGKFEFTMIKGTEKLVRTTYEKHNDKEFNIINQDMLQAYKDLLACHNESAAARKGSISNYAISTNVLCLKKTLGTENVVIIVNVRNSNQSFSVPSPLTGSWTNALTNASYTLNSTISLTPYQYIILKN